MKKPELTVVMPVYNGEKYLAEAIDSVLNQTFENFELIIVNDCSTDRSASIISAYDDPRIRVLTNAQNKGIPFNRNLGLKAAQGEFLCWIDCDDLNMPQRFEKQISFLRTHPSYGGCGTWLARFKGTKVFYANRALSDPEQIKAALLFRPATVPNATAMLRMSEIKKYDLWYNTALPISEDYDFIFRCTRQIKFSNLQEVLYKYRDSETSIMRQFETLDQKSYEISKTIYKQAFNELNIETTPTNFYTHYMLCSEKIFENYKDYIVCYDWLEKIESANGETKIYDNKALHKVLGNQMYFASKKASKFGFKTLFFFLKKIWENNWPINIKELSKLVVRCLLRHDKFEFRRQ